MNQNIESVKVYLRSKIPARAKKIGKEAAIKEFSERFDVPESWCEGAFDQALLEKDSLDNEMMDIHTYDIYPLHPNARFIEGVEPLAKWMQPLAERRFLNGQFEDVAYFVPFYLKDFVAIKPKKLL